VTKYVNAASLVSLTEVISIAYSQHVSGDHSLWSRVPHHCRCLVSLEDHHHSRDLCQSLLWLFRYREALQIEVHSQLVPRLRVKLLLLLARPPVRRLLVLRLVRVRVRVRVLARVLGRVLLLVLLLALLLVLLMLLLLVLPVLLLLRILLHEDFVSFER
jgi:hypothetical protein